MVPFEGLHELYEDFGFGLLARSYLWVGSAIVARGEFLHIQLTILVEVEGSESALNEVPSELAHLANDDAQEFREVNLATLVDVHGLEEALNVLRVDVDAEVMAALFEFHEIKSAGTIVVSNLELATESDDAVGSTRFERLPESFDQDALEFGNWWLGINLETWLEFTSFRLTHS